MIIHVVKPGETLYSIAQRYRVSYNRIAAYNELSNAEQLAVGQTLVILEGRRNHIVSSGQTLYTIANIYGISVKNILFENPQIANSGMIFPGQTIIIPEKTKKFGTIEVNGYAFVSVDREVLRKTLPYLTYLSIFSHQVRPDGSISELNDVPLIQVARSVGVAPLMVITNISSKGGFSSDIARATFTDDQVQEKLINNIISMIRDKQYYGLDIDFEYVYPDDRENYNRFIRKVKDRLGPLGYPVSSALAPKIYAEQKGKLYEAHDYPVHGDLMDHVILMTYEWGFTYGPPMAVAPVNEVRRVIDYAVTAIPNKKILMGIPNYGYDWTLPYVEGTSAKPLSNKGAVALTIRTNSDIKYSEKSQSPFFNYYDANGKEHVVWFEDARSIRAKLELVNEYGIGGISYWTIGRFFPQNWLVLRSLYNIRKVL